ncbi:MAG: RidA family protein [Gammaproteobacteria bacterium]|nr:RidA family protein [Gammaproteobacteria bacterium]
MRRNISSGAPWEGNVGYSRAVRIGNIIAVAGTTGSDADGNPVGDTAAQARLALERIQAALEEAGATLADVIRTRIYVTDISEWEAVGQVHGEFFADIRPAASMVEVSRLITPGLTVEIEADAVVSD